MPKRVAIDSTKLIKHKPTGGRGESPGQPKLIKHKPTGGSANRTQPSMLRQSPEVVSKVGERTLRHPMDEKGKG